ncbi:3-phosphoshikimate 1-carboxyvinyltransferase [Alphaproteobacteria bacterium HT1-32]|nr:3-phosphoshikimate 1-carboxyvinyltransferase [Alphaproteobacteria bacterium HT1-32]
MQPFESRPSRGLQGVVSAPGDKSVSHRSLMLGGLAVGETTITGLLEGEDVLATADAMRAFGAEISRDADGVWHVHGRGIGALREPVDIIDMGNAGTGVRLLMGIAATHPVTVVFTGDASLRRRPMERIAAPLRLFGAEFTGREGTLLPLTVRGAANPLPVEYETPVASAQVKSAVLLAGLNTPGRTTVVERVQTRDHTERMLTHFGAVVKTETLADGGARITLEGQPELTGRAVVVPGDPSSAAFPLVAGLLTEGSEVVVRNVGLNPGRIGLFTTLREMGADITFLNERVEAGEPVADIRTRYSRLTAVEVPAGRAASMIDEYPVLAAAAATAKGITRFVGVGELRVKESDRLALVAAGLTQCGVEVEEGPDWLTITGCDGPPPGGAEAVVTSLDHRICMAFLVFGLACRKPVAIDDAAPIATSFPGFIDLMQGLGADLSGIAP